MPDLTNAALVAAACTFLGALPARDAAAQPATSTTTRVPTYKRDIPDSLSREASVTEAAALATAQQRVPKGRVDALELEREKGVLMYSFDFKVPGKSGIDEVNVDAKTGAVLHVEHESPAAERKEAAEDAKAASTAKVKRTGRTP